MHLIYYFFFFVKAINPDGVEIPQINRMTFKYPPSPILSQPEAIPEEMICSLEHRSQVCENNPHFCECLQILPVEQKKNIEIILINEGESYN